MSSELPAISVQDVSKRFRVFAKPADRLKAAVRHRIGGLAKLVPARLLGTEGASEFHALQHVSFHVQKGETIGIIGRNGSGKSTLLQIICGTLTPSGGRVVINGRVAALLELGAGFNPEFTGRENVYMNAALLGLSKAQIEERLDAIFAFADIGGFVDQPVKTYSSGMYVRLAFAVIAHVDADVLVIDEALAVGDAFFTQKCMRFLRAFMERGTVLLSATIRTRWSISVPASYGLTRGAFAKSVRQRTFATRILRLSTRSSIAHRGEAFARLSAAVSCAQ